VLDNLASDQTCQSVAAMTRGSASVWTSRDLSNTDICREAWEPERQLTRESATIQVGVPLKRKSLTLTSRLREMPM
jgi:hypothetical protein